MTMGERIRAAREKKQLSQTELATFLGYKSRSSINKIEMGGRDIPRSVIVKLAEALNVSPSYLMGWTDDPTDYKALVETERENQEIAANERQPDNFQPTIFNNNGENYGMIGNAHAPVKIVNGKERTLTAQEAELLRLFSELSVIEQAKVLAYASELKEKRDKL